ncbi:hypothetical protein ACTFIZ_008782 [Dictyostelium cf. discoideum]
MIVKYIFIYLFFIYNFIIVKSDCDFTNNESAHSLLVTKLNCTKQKEKIILYYNEETFINLNISNDGFYYFDILNYDKKNRLCDISNVITFTPQIPAFPIIPTTGGNFNFTYNFPCTYVMKDIKYIYLNRVITVIPTFNSDQNNFNITIPEGCGNLEFYSNQMINFFNTTYEKGIIENKPFFDGEGSLIIKGSNLLKTTIKIISNENVSNDSPIGVIDSSHSNVLFQIPDSRYQGNWRIDVMICGDLYASYDYQLLPLLNKFEELLNENGGNITLIGNNLRSRYNVTGIFGNKSIDCYSMDSSNKVICNLPSLIESGSIGYDIPLIINIDGKYRTNTIKLSFISFNQTDTPFNQTETPFNQTETPFNQTNTPLKPHDDELKPPKFTLTDKLLPPISFGSN